MTNQHLADRAAALVATWPPLTEEQRARIRKLLTPVLSQSTKDTSEERAAA